MEKRARTPRWVIRFISKLQVKKKMDRRVEPPDTFLEEPSKDYFIKILFLLSKWFQTERFLWEFPLGSYVKLSSAVAAILVGGLKSRTHFRKGTTQGSIQKSLVDIGSVVSEEKISFKFHPPFFYFKLGGHLGWKLGSPDIILEGGHPRTIPPKCGCNWPSGFWGEG